MCFVYITIINYLYLYLPFAVLQVIFTIVMDVFRRTPHQCFAALKTGAISGLGGHPISSHPGPRAGRSSRSTRVLVDGSTRLEW
jgi:hypothetical protein